MSECFVCNGPLEEIGVSFAEQKFFIPKHNCVLYLKETLQAANAEIERLKEYGASMAIKAGEYSTKVDGLNALLQIQEEVSIKNRQRAESAERKLAEIARMPCKKPIPVYDTAGIIESKKDCGVCASCLAREFCDANKIPWRDLKESK